MSLIIENEKPKMKKWTEREKFHVIGNKLFWDLFCLFIKEVLIFLKKHILLQLKRYRELLGNFCFLHFQSGNEDCSSYVAKKYAKYEN